jgi:DNA-binding transcriptional ArsR family regulator
MSGARVAGGAGWLSTDLAASFSPSLQDALNHPLRREILRVLHAPGGSRGVAEILGELSPFTRGEVSYHLQILQRCGAVASAGTRPGPVTREHLYESALLGDEEVATVLRATAEFDRGHRQQREGDHSAGFLTMFRIPRPERTIRLGLRPRAGSGR